jgi:hypothetical protein
MVYLNQFHKNAMERREKEPDAAEESASDISDNHIR